MTAKQERRMIVDTTLRDGEQSPFVHFSEANKLLLAKMLDNAGVYQIEAGIVAIGKNEQHIISKIMENRKNSRISVWCRLNPDDVRLAIECCPDVIHISIPVSYLHIYKKLKKNKAWVYKCLNHILELVTVSGCRLSVGFEDAMRADISFMQELLNILEPYGTEMIRIADTVGLSAPYNIRNTIAMLLLHTNIPLEIHAHNDLGMAVANTAEALKAGAMFADTTVCGIGERTGNCDTVQLLHLLGAVYDLGVSESAAEELNQELIHQLGLEERK